ncbi:hypothetical protein ACOSQ3_011203 [Xanthoceras sorbifolium]
MAPQLPDSLIFFELLIRVPVKSLARFKCVNRFWCSLISHSDFIYTHLEAAKRLYNNSRLIISCLVHDDNLCNSSTLYFYLIRDDHEPAVLEYSTQVSYDSYHFLPSCNGLVCFYGAHAAGIYVCNPSTKNIVRIPDSIETGSRLLSCGFGFDQRTRNYKIIKISNVADDDDLQIIEMLTMGTSSWRAVKIINGRFGFPNRQPPVFANGFFYWISAFENSSGFFIQSFDIGRESFGIIHVPESVSRKDWRLFSLEELGGDQLCLVDMDFESEGKKRMDLWLFKFGVVVVSDCDADDQKKKPGYYWVQETILHPSEPLDATRPVAFRGREILLHGFIRGLDDVINWYDLQTGRFRGVDIGEIPSMYFHVRSYVESIVSLQI